MSESAGAEPGDSGGGSDRRADERKGRVVIRPATRADFDEMLAEPLPYRCVAFTAEKDGEVLGVGGFTFLPNDTVAAFVHMKEGANRNKVALHRAGLAAVSEMKRRGVRRVVALAQDGIEPARRWLERLGFRPQHIDNQEVWIWQHSHSSRAD